MRWLDSLFPPKIPDAADAAILVFIFAEWGARVEFWHWVFSLTHSKMPAVKAARSAELHFSGNFFRVVQLSVMKS